MNMIMYEMPVIYIITNAKPFIFCSFVCTASLRFCYLLKKRQAKKTVCSFMS